METKLINFFVIGTPIGNYDDITLRAIKILKQVDFIVCEEEKEYKKLFNILGIKEKKYILCNEHNEKDAIEIALPLLKKGETGALISDCGTPLFEDPGFELLKAIRKAEFKITSIPGANSLVTCLSLSPFRVKDFYFAGFLPQKKEERKNILNKILSKSETIVIFEAPYRLLNFLNLLKEHLIGRKIFLTLNLTKDDELILTGYPDKILEILEKKNIKKAEFIIIIESKKNQNK